MKSKNKTFSILIVDDQAIEIASLNYLALNLGLEVNLAFDGKQAWSLVTQNHYDLIVLDWHMPIIPGWTFLKLLENERIERLTKKQNIVLYTAQPLQVDDFTANEKFQVLDVWNKPLTPLDLVHKIKKTRFSIGA